MDNTESESETVIGPQRQLTTLKDVVFGYKVRLDLTPKEYKDVKSLHALV